LREPEFWRWRSGRDAAPLLVLALSPLAFAYQRAVAHRIKTTTPVRLAQPVICVGALTLGGAGKTPLTAALARLGQDMGREVHIVSRGFRGRERGPLRVDPTRHTARDVGDEPLLLAQTAPVWVAKDKIAGAKAAIAAGADLILLDDGHQNPSLAKALSIVAVDAGFGFGNGRVFPAGPLREPIRAGLARADAVALLNGDADPDDGEQLTRSGKPILRAAITPLAPPPTGPLLAFCGIARPEKFFDALRAAGAAIADFAIFPDHHYFTPSDLNRLARAGDRAKAQLITTEKDWVRIPAPARAAIQPFRIRMNLSAPDEWRALLARAIKA